MGRIFCIIFVHETQMANHILIHVILLWTYPHFDQRKKHFCGKINKKYYHWYFTYKINLINLKINQRFRLKIGIL